jgi:hypothetical protein
MPRPLGRAGGALLCTVVLCPAMLYRLTLLDSVGGGDSGEFLHAAMALAPAHPPGYPLLLMALTVVTGRGAGPDPGVEWH